MPGNTTQTIILKDPRIRKQLRNLELLFQTFLLFKFASVSKKTLRPLTLPVELKQLVELIVVIKTAEWGLLLAGAYSGDRLDFRQDWSRHATVVPQNGAWNTNVDCAPGNSRAAKSNIVTTSPHMLLRSTNYSDSKITAKTYWRLRVTTLILTHRWWGWGWWWWWWELCLRFWLPACARTGELLRDCLHELVQRRTLIYKQVRQQEDGGGHYDHQHLPHPHLTTPCLLGAHPVSINSSHQNFK